MLEPGDNRKNRSLHRAGRSNAGTRPNPGITEALMFTHHRTPTRLASTIALTLILAAATGCNRDPNVRKHKYLESGQRYEQQGKYKEAAIQIQNALKIDRNFADAHYELGRVYFKMEAMSAAHNEFMKAVDLAPENVPARLDLGNLELGGGYPDGATAQANAILTLNPNNPDAFSLLASIAASQGNRDEALKDMQRALELDPHRPIFHTKLALLEAPDPQHSGVAQQELQSAIALDPSDATAHLALASVFERQNNIPAAEDQLLIAEKQAPKNLQAREGLAGLYIHQGDQAKALEVVRKATEDFADSEKGAELLGNYYASLGHLDDAENDYSALVAKNPKSFQLSFAYARILLLKHEDSKVRDISASLAKLNPRSPEVQILNSSLLLDEGKVDEASDMLQKAVKNAPDSFRLQLALGRVSLDKRDLPTAETAFREAARIDPRSLEAQKGFADVADAKGDAAMLAQAADKALIIDPSYADATLWRATAEANEKQYDKAQTDLQAVVARNPNNSAAIVELAQLQLVARHVPEATALLDKALTVDPNSVAALDQLIRVYVLTGQTDKAITRVQDQIDKSPRNVSFYIQLAALQNSVKNYNDGLVTAQKALNINPDSERAIEQYATAQVGLHNPTAAISMWEHWLPRHPNNAAGTSMIAQLEEGKGDQAKAMEYYKKSLAIEPGQVWASNNLAYLMVENNQNLDVALTLAQQARTALPHSADTADTLAWVYYAKARYGLARDLLEDAVTTDPQNASIQYHLGLAYSKLGDKTNAVLHLKRATTLAPDQPTGKAAAAALTQLG